MADRKNPADDVVIPLNQNAARGANLPALRIVDVGDLADLDVPVRRWFVHNLIPLRQVTLFSGDGAVGKSLLALQLSIAAATATDWIGYMPEVGPCMYLSAEDEIDEHHIRIAEICAAQSNIKMATMKGKLQIVDLVEEDSLIAALGRDGRLQRTPLFVSIERRVAEFRPILLVVDTLADFYGGEENTRAQVRQFVKWMKGLALRYDLAVIILAHPSLTGMSSGSGLSGSTAWNGSVRSRIYLEKVKNDGQEIDPDLRKLSTKKLNYGPGNAETILRWEKGRYTPVNGPEGAVLSRAAADRQAEDLFLRLLADLTRQGRAPSPSKSPTYAPSVMAKLPGAAGTTSQAFERAMERLLDRNALEIVWEGAPSKRRARLVKVEF